LRDRWVCYTEIQYGQGLLYVHVTVTEMLAITCWMQYCTASCLLSSMTGIGTFLDTINS
jgi:hypothetical protein